MTTVQVPADTMRQLEAIAALEDCDVDLLVLSMLGEAIDDRRDRVRDAYQALFGARDGARPTAVVADEATRGATNGHGPPPTPPAKKAPATKAARKRCVRGDCDKKVRARGMCATHYSRWRDGLDATAPDGTPSPAIAKDTQDTQEGASDPEPAPRTHDVDEGGRQDSQPPEAGDGPPSSTSTPEPQGEVEVDTDDPSCCQAARCRSAKESIGDDFCPTHTSILKRMTAKLRAEFGEDARDEATDRIMAGVR